MPLRKTQKTTAATPTTEAEKPTNKRHLPVSEAREKFLELLHQEGRLSRTEAKKVMAGYGFPPNAKWTEMCRELEGQGLITAGKREGEDTVVHYVLTVKGVDYLVAKRMKTVRRMLNEARADRADR